MAFWPVWGWRLTGVLTCVSLIIGLPQWLSSKESTCRAGDLGSVPGSGRSCGGGNGKPLQYSSLKSPMDRGAWRATVQRVKHDWVTEHALKYLGMLAIFSCVIAHRFIFFGELSVEVFFLILFYLFMYLFSYSSIHSFIFYIWLPHVFIAYMGFL